MFEAESHKITTTTPDSRIGDSLPKILLSFYRELQQNRWQIWMAFKKDFVSQYKQTVLGFIWSIILPIIPISVYLFLGLIKAVRMPDNMHFAVYIVIGRTLWFFLSANINSIMKALSKEKQLLSKVKYPLITVLASNFGRVVYELLVSTVFVLVVLLIFKISLNFYMILLPLLLIPLVFFSVGTGMILSILNIIYRDIEKITTIILTYGVFLSSVIFPMPDSGISGSLIKFNPFNTFINEIRNIIVFGSLDDVNLFLITSLISLIIFLTGCKIVYLMEFRIKQFL